MFYFGSFADYIIAILLDRFTQLDRGFLKFADLWFLTFMLSAAGVTGNGHYEAHFGVSMAPMYNRHSYLVKINKMPGFL